MSRLGSTQEDWPFQPWPARRRNTLGGWHDDTADTAMVTSPWTARTWVLLALIPILVVGLAGVAVARLVADETVGEASSEKGLTYSASLDRHLAALVREHRRVVRGL